MSDPILAKLDEILDDPDNYSATDGTGWHQECLGIKLRALLAEVAIEYYEVDRGVYSHGEIRKRFGVPSEGEKT